MKERGIYPAPQHMDLAGLNAHFQQAIGQVTAHGKDGVNTVENVQDPRGGIARP